MPSEIVHEAPIYVDIEIPPLLHEQSDWGEIPIASWHDEDSSWKLNDSRAKPSNVDESKELKVVITGIARLETNIKWEAVTAEFKAEREKWLESLRACTTVVGVAKCLRDFTRYLDRAYISDLEYFESDWLDLLSTPTLTLGTLCSLVLELEEMLDPSSTFAPSWKDAAYDWREQLEEIEQNSM